MKFKIVCFANHQKIWTDVTNITLVHRKHQIQISQFLFPPEILFSLQKVVGILDKSLKPPKGEKCFKMYFCVDQQHLLSSEFIRRHPNEVWYYLMMGKSMFFFSCIFNSSVCVRWDAKVSVSLFYNCFKCDLIH